MLCIIQLVETLPETVGGRLENAHCASQMRCDVVMIKETRLLHQKKKEKNVDVCNTEGDVAPCQDELYFSSSSPAKRCRAEASAKLTRAHILPRARRYAKL